MGKVGMGNVSMANGPMGNVDMGKVDMGVVPNLIIRAPVFMIQPLMMPLLLLLFPI